MTTVGGVTVKVMMGRTAGGLLHYRDQQKEGQAEPYLFAASKHCSHDAALQVAEWAATRKAHGTQNAKRTARATYEPVDENGLAANGERGTHVRAWVKPKTGGRARNRTRPARRGETPTHLRIEPEQATVKQHDAVHTIYAFGADLVNPDSAEDCERAFLAFRAFAQGDAPGLQESFWGERNGKSGLFHIHRASHATIHADFTLGGREFKAGSKMAGTLTDVHDVRNRFNSWLDEHPEHGLKQSLARVGTAEYEQAQVRSKQRDYWNEREDRGQVSNHELLRRAIRGPNGLASCAPTTQGFISGMATVGVEVKEVGIRRGKPTKGHDYSYRLQGTLAWARGKTLGTDFTITAISAKQEQVARGETIAWTAKQQAGPAKPLSLITDEELDGLRALASAERRAQFDETWDEASRLNAQWDLQRERELEQQEIVRQQAAAQRANLARVAAQAQVAAVDVQAGVVSAAMAEPVRFRSRLRTIKARTFEDQQALDQRADFEEEAVAMLARGEHPTEQDTAALGIGPKFLEQFGHLLDPVVRDALQRRHELRREANHEYTQTSQPLRARSAVLKEQGLKAADLNWMFGNEAQGLREEIKKSDRRLKRLQRQISDGMYWQEPAAPTTVTAASVMPALDAQDTPDVGPER